MDERTVLGAYIFIMGTLLPHVYLSALIDAPEPASGRASEPGSNPDSQPSELDHIRIQNLAGIRVAPWPKDTDQSAQAQRIRREAERIRKSTNTQETEYYDELSVPMIAPSDYIESFLRLKRDLFKPRPALSPQGQSAHN